MIVILSRKDFAPCSGSASHPGGTTRATSPVFNLRNARYLIGTRVGIAGATAWVLV